MRTFIVAREKYDCYSAGEVSLEMHKAEGLEDLAVILLRQMRKNDEEEDEGDEPTESDWDLFCGFQGDGCDAYTISELRNDKLHPIGMSGDINADDTSAEPSQEHMCREQYLEHLANQDPFESPE